jgi:hypothetical protein
VHAGIVTVLPGWLSGATIGADAAFLFNQSNITYFQSLLPVSLYYYVL